MDVIKGDPEVLKRLGVGRKRRVGRWIFRAFVLMAIVAGAAGVWAWRVRTSKDKAEHYVTVPVERSDLRETVIATGTLSPLDSVQVGAEVTGRVLKVNVTVNDLVKEGQVIAEIDPQVFQTKVEEAQAQLASASAAYESAKATAKEAEATAKRKRELNARGLASDADRITADAALDRARASIATSAAQISIARAGVKNAETTKSKSIIRAPIDGVVLARTVEVGQTVTAGFQTPVLFTIGRDLTGMRLNVDVDEADVGKVRDGQSASFVVDAYPKREFLSKVVRLSNMPKADTTVITYEAELTVDNSERLLRPGMTATATIVASERKNVLTVPNAALRFRPPAANKSSSGPGGPPGFPLPGMGGGMRRGRSGSARPASSAAASGAGSDRAAKDAVWALDGAGLRRVPVRVGGSDGRRSEVEGALGPGTLVVVDVEEATE